MPKYFFFLPLLFLFSCVLGPNYRRPCLPVPEAYRYASKETNDALELMWWEQFEDPVLVDLIREALTHNEELKVATARVKEALASLIQVRSPFFPQIGYTGSYSRTRQSEAAIPSGNVNAFSSKNPYSNWQAFLTGGFELDLWGRTKRLSEAAEAGLYGSCQAKRAALLSLVSSVASSYILLRALDEQLVVSLNTKESYKKEVDYFEKQFKYGQSSEMAVAQARTQYETAAAKIPQIQTQIAHVENALSILLGSIPKEIPRGKSIYDLKMPQVPAGLPSELLCRRPDIVEAEEQLIAANALIGAAKALYFPTISLTGNFGSVSSELSSLFTGPAKSWNFAVGAAGPLFTGGSVYGQVLQAKAQREAALHLYKKTIQNAFADVENAFSAHTFLLQQLESEKKLVDSAGLYQRLASLQYKAGYSPYFVVIQAEEQFFPAQLSWVGTRAAAFTSLIQIYQSLGGGWVSLAEKLSSKEDCSMR